MGCCPDKLSVIVYHSMKPLQLFDGGWWFYCQNCLHFFLQGTDALGVDLVAQEFDSGLAQHTFFAVDNEAILIENGEDFPEVFQMFLKSGRSDENII